MAEYIEREATIELYCQKCKGYYDGHCIHRGQCDIDVLQAAPSVDVKPVKHGEWLISSDGYYPYCSECYCRPNGELTIAKHGKTVAEVGTICRIL